MYMSSPFLNSGTSLVVPSDTNQNMPTLCDLLGAAPAKLEQNDTQNQRQQDMSSSFGFRQTTSVKHEFDMRNQSQQNRHLTQQRTDIHGAQSYLNANSLTRQPQSVMQLQTPIAESGNMQHFSTPRRPVNSMIPLTPVTYAVSMIPMTPITSKIPVTPETYMTPVTSKISVTPETYTIPMTPMTPVSSKTPMTPETYMTPMTSATSNIHVTSKLPVTPVTSMTPVTPMTFATSKIPMSSLTSMTPITPVSQSSSIELSETPQLQNIVSTVNLGCKLSLKKIVLHAKNAEYNPKRFTAVIMRIREPRTTALIFASGKIVCTGAKSEDDSRLAARKFARIIQKIGFDAKFLDFKIQNIVGSCDVKFKIKLECISLEYQNYCSYEPEIFPGLVFRMMKPKVVLIIFISGKIVFTGAKVRKYIYEAYENIYPILKKYRR